MTSHPISHTTVRETLFTNLDRRWTEDIKRVLSGDMNDIPFDVPNMVRIYVCGTGPGKDKGKPAWVHTELETIFSPVLCTLRRLTVIFNHRFVEQIPNFRCDYHIAGYRSTLSNGFTAQFFWGGAICQAFSSS